MNMSYCQFHNTLLALQDCYNNWDNELSEEEEKNRQRLIILCDKIHSLKNYEEEENE